MLATVPWRQAAVATHFPYTVSMHESSANHRVFGMNQNSLKKHFAVEPYTTSMHKIFATHTVFASIRILTKKRPLQTEECNQNYANVETTLPKSTKEK